MARGTSAGAQDRGGAAPVAAALDMFLRGAYASGLSDAARAARAWYVANGDRERARTVGVWLRPSGKAGVDPQLVVVVDSNLYAGELGANKDLYLTRLAYHGLVVSDIRFTVGRREGGSARGRRAGLFAGEEERRDEIELSARERQQVREAVKDLPEGLQKSVSRAMCATLRRYKASQPTKE